MWIGRTASAALGIFILTASFMSPARAEDQRDYFIMTYGQAEPLIYEQDGQAKGIYVELMKELIVKELGREIRFRQRPWKRAQHEVEIGAADLLITLPTERRREYALISDQPVFPLYFAIYTYADHPRLIEINKINSVQDIAKLDLLAVTNLGNGWHKANVQDKGVRTYVAPSDRNIAGVLALKRADIMIDITVTMNHVISKQGLTDKLTLTDVRFGPTHMYLMLGKKSPFTHLMPEIEAALVRMRQDGRMERIVEQYSRLTPSG
ncbi:substrate-binding periplasmic protein [Aestuariispira insulae]|uniref:ABC-type amino acid transport substrate-binding protein n=1 Tax=Aestuariispira insulae TaxID=1461337 RepID=A0A3D9HL56_9PROT|nr:transporter substrate-binding domain-containing protein [Aestuariispira insulae]RED49636.1 ABC-type amino acid transport substrate-binding protein [Aestuariispira insulae]